MTVTEDNRLTADIESYNPKDLLLHSSGILSTTLDPQELVKIILRLIHRLVPSEASWLYLRGRKNDRFHILTRQGIQSQLLTSDDPLSKWLKRVTNPASLSQSDLQEAWCTNLRGLIGLKCESLLAVPIERRNKISGLLGSVNAKGDTEFSTGHRDSLVILAEQVAVAVENSFLFNRVKEESLKKEILLEIDRQLNSTLELEDVLKTILASIQKVVKCDAAGIFLVKKQTQEVEKVEVIGYDPALAADLNLKIGQGLIGEVAKTGEPIIVPDVRENSQYVNARPETMSEMVAPILLKGEIMGVLNLESNNLNAFNEDDLEQLLVFANQVAFSIERARLQRLAIDRGRMVDELSVARHIQETFLPKQNPRIPGFEIAGANISSEQVGGDYYDFISIEGNQLGIVVGDVSGKGVPAALIMAAFRASLKAEIRNNYAIRTIFQKVNLLLYESLERENFVTAIYGVLDPQNKIFTYSNAGHNPPMLVHSNGEIEYLTGGGLALGILPDSTYQESATRLSEGDLLLLYTDGVTEATNKAKEEYGVTRLVNLLKKHRKQSASELQKTIMESVNKFTRTPTADDLTLVIIKVN
ncbi:MAG: SpoIIE family protein phosphatase [candidate division Zixibacteria bacterium]|nr:SpoIIE family protein phosphatase [candidate division Zixibacteria bacterium]